MEMTASKSLSTLPETDHALNQAALLAQQAFDANEHLGTPLGVQVECTKALCYEIAALRNLIELSRNEETNGPARPI